MLCICDEQAGILMSISEPSVFLLEMSLDSSHWGLLQNDGGWAVRSRNIKLSVGYSWNTPGSNELSIVSNSVGLFLLQQLCAASSMAMVGLDVTSLHLLTRRDMIYIN
jgi:hypothetical protein